MDNKRLEIIEQTWGEIGWRAKPLKRWVFVRTELLPDKIGSLYLPPTLRGNYAQLGHKVLMRALVLSTGPQCRILKPGDRIAFPRLFFARWHYLEDKSLAGWVDEDNISGYDLTQYPGEEIPEEITADAAQ